MWQLATPLSVSLPGDGDDEVLVRLKLRAADLGIRPPPTRCRIRACETTTRWILLVRSSHGPTDATRAWARGVADGEEVSFGKAGPRTLAFRCERLPEPWQRLFGLFDADHLLLEPDGTALTQLRGSREEVGAYLSGMDSETETEAVSVLPEGDETPREPLLTELQRRALERAAALGYFEVPRRIQLDELADRLDTSPSALSELLRRAQSRLVSAHLDNRLGGLGALLDLGEAEG